MDSDGPDLYFPEFDAPETRYGRTTGTDYDRNGRFFGRYTMGGLALSLVASRREKGVSNAGFGVQFDDPGNRAIDSTSFADLSYYRNIGEATELSGRVFWSDYAYRGRGIYLLSDFADVPEGEADPEVLNQDDARGQWWGGEVKLVSALGASHKLIAGVEYQSNYRQDQTNYNDDPYLSFMDERHRSERYGIYAQDEYAFSETLKLSVGARADKVTDQDAQFSPRFGVVWKPSEQTVWKLLYGGAFRAPNVYERYYVYPGSNIANTLLQPEKIRTFELAFEHYLTPQTRLFAGAYYYRMDQLIEAVPVQIAGGTGGTGIGESGGDGAGAAEGLDDTAAADGSAAPAGTEGAEPTEPTEATEGAQGAGAAVEEDTPPAAEEPTLATQYQNVSAVRARGIEFEIEHQWQNGARLRASLDLQRTSATGGERLSNSPQAIGRMNLSAPLPWWALRVGVEGQALSSRRTDLGTTVPGYGVVNLTLWRPQSGRNWEVSASVFNLFDRKFSDPAAPDVTLPERDRFERDGRTYRLKAVLHF
jgi:outer membrane receptor protein involved in Fe transport